MNVEHLTESHDFEQMNSEIPSMSNLLLLAQSSSLCFCTPPVYANIACNICWDMVLVIVSVRQCRILKIAYGEVKLC